MRRDFPEHEGDYICVIIGLICLMITISVVVTQLRLAITGEECKQEVKQPVVERHIKYKRFSHNFHTQEHTDKIRSAVYNSLLPFAGNQHKIFKRKSAQLEARITKNK